MRSAVIDFPNLRQGVAAVRVPRGVLFHDAHRWQLFLVGGDQNPEKVFAWMKANALVDGAPIPKTTPRVSQVFMVARDQAPEGGFTLLDEARFTCSCCGASCRSMNLGPLLPADVERLRGLDWTGTAHDPANFFAERNGDPVEDQPDEPIAGRGDLFLRREGDACQFLGPDQRCEVHSRFGALAKPHMCRAFPIQLRAAPTGVVVGLRLDECLEAEKALLGPKLDDDAEALRYLWSELPKVQVLPPQIWLAEGVLVPWAEYEALEQRLLLQGPVESHPGQAHGGGIAFLLRAVSAVLARAGRPMPQAAAPADLIALRRWALDLGSLASTDAAGSTPAAAASQPLLPLARATAAGLDDAAFRLEERIARILLFNKDALQHIDLLRGLSQLVVKLWLMRERALDKAGKEGVPRATAAHLNRAAKEGAHDPLRDQIANHKLDPVALAAAVAALAQ